MNDTLSSVRNLSVTEARYFGDFAVRLTFSDGHGKLVDFKPFPEEAKYPATKKYLDKNRFKGFQIKDGNWAFTKMAY